MFGGPSGRLPSLNQASNHNFSQVPKAHIQRSAFDRSNKHMTTLNAGELVPFFLDEVLPGDTYSVNSTIFARLMTSLVPAMDTLVISTQFFFVPNRLVWNNWEKFCGAQDNPGDSISFTIPQMIARGWSKGSLGDYFGLPSQADSGPQVGIQVGGANSFCSALPFRAYALIFNTWYRDENIQSSTTIDKGDGPDSTTGVTVRVRGKRKDYFYGSLTAAQKGTAVPFLTGTANVYGTAPTNTTGGMAWQGWNQTDGAVQFGGLSKAAGSFGTVLGGIAGWTGAAAGDDIKNLHMATAAQYTTLGSGMSPPYADLSTNVTDVVNTLRLAFQTQKFLERDARGGTRYTELILSHFGVTNPDFRLQRPEYLGGGVADINATPIPQTTPTGIAGTSTKFGDLAAFSTSLSPRNGFTKSFTEHGHIIGIVSVSAPLTYQQGLHRMWTRQTRYDFYWPVFAHLGEQTVASSEIFFLGDKAGANTDATVWGYQERYGEYRYKPSQISGMFRSNITGTLDSWHFAQNYASRPALTSTYIIDDTNTNLDRNLAVPQSSTSPQFKLDIANKIHTARCMPVFGVPGNMDRF